MITQKPGVDKVLVRTVARRKKNRIAQNPVRFLFHSKVKTPDTLRQGF